jgi:hypothetical protein
MKREPAFYYSTLANPAKKNAKQSEKNNKANIYRRFCRISLTFNKKNSKLQSPILFIELQFVGEFFPKVSQSAEDNNSS